MDQIITGLYTRVEGYLTWIEKNLNIKAECNQDGIDCCFDISLIGNRKCDAINNFSSCGHFDRNDCRVLGNTEWPNCPHNPDFIGDGKCDDHLVNAECNYDNGDCCQQSWIGDEECNDQNNVASDSNKKI